MTMAKLNEKRRYVIGNCDDMRALQRLTSNISVFGGTCDGDKPVVTIKIQHDRLAKPYVFHCFYDDVLIEYEDDSWGIIEKETTQSRALSALCGRW